MKSDPTVYAYRMPENLSADEGEFNGDVLASKTIDIQLEDRAIPAAVVFMRMSKADFKAALRDKSSGIHSSKQTREHFRNLLTSRGNSAETVDQVLARIDNDYSKNKGGEQHLRQEQKKLSSHYAVRLLSISAEKFRQLLPQSTRQQKKENPLLAKAFELTTAKAINKGTLQRVNEKGVAYTYSAKKNNSGNSVQTVPGRVLPEKSTDALPIKHGRHFITRKAHIRPDNPALRQALQEASSTATSASVTTSQDGGSRQGSDSNS
jgi:hypothetical protein